MRGDGSVLPVAARSAPPTKIEIPYVCYLPLGAGSIHVKDFLHARPCLDFLHFLCALRGEEAVEFTEGNHVHQVELTCDVRVLQALEHEGAVHAQLGRLNVAAPGERLDGQRVAHPHAVEFQLGRQLVVEEAVAVREIGVVDPEEFGRWCSA